ncbi:MAG: ATP-binding cassette domain-containing protein [Chloroflexota bacterium]
MNESARVLLDVGGVWKAFGKNQVLRGMSLQVAAGEVVAVVGENGSGKSTLLKILAGLEVADRGTVRMSGRIGYCPQSLELFEGLTVAENLIYFGAAYGLTQDGLRQAGRRYLDRFRFTQYTGTLVSRLSGGTKQKLNLTLALLHNPALLLLDEPYQGFDYETFMNFASLLDEWRNDGKAVLTISHLITGDLRIDRTLELEDGVTHERAPDRHRA